MCACETAPASLIHTLCECPNTDELRSVFGVPSVSWFLRTYLLNLTSKELAEIIYAWEPYLQLGSDSTI